MKGERAISSDLLVRVFSAAVLLLVVSVVCWSIGGILAYVDRVTSLLTFLAFLFWIILLVARFVEWFSRSRAL